MRQRQLFINLLRLSTTHTAALPHVSTAPGHLVHVRLRGGFGSDVRALLLQVGRPCLGGRRLLGAPQQLGHGRRARRGYLRRSGRLLHAPTVAAAEHVVAHRLRTAQSAALQEKHSLARRQLADGRHRPRDRNGKGRH